MPKATITCFLLGSAIVGVSGSAHADWAVLGVESGVTLVGAVSSDAASGYPKGASISATCIKGKASDGLLTFAFTNTPAAEKIDMVPGVPTAYRLIIDGVEIAHVSSGPTKSTTAEGRLQYGFIWSVAVVNAIANAQKEIKMVFDGDPTSIVMSALGSTKAAQSFLQQCGSYKDVIKADKDSVPTAQDKAEITRSEAIVMMVGSTIHAESVCHQPFTNREGYVAIKELAKGLGIRDTAKFLKLNTRNMENFDSTIKVLGKASACASIDHVLAGFEK